MDERVSTRERTLGRHDAVKLLKKADELVASKGRNVIRLELKSVPVSDEAIGLMLGPTGNLRAPTFTSGKTVVVGFDEASYKQVLE